MCVRLEMQPALQKASSARARSGHLQGRAEQIQASDRTALAILTGEARRQCRFALNLIRLNPSAKTIIKTKRLLAATSDEFRAALLGVAVEG